MIAELFKIIREPYDFNHLNEKQSYLASLLDDDCEQCFENPFSELEKVVLAQELIDIAREDLLNELIGPSYKVFVYLLNKNYYMYLHDCVRYWKENEEPKIIIENILREIPSLPKTQEVFYEKDSKKIAFENEYFNNLWNLLDLPFSLSDNLQLSLELIHINKIKVNFNLKELILEDQSSYRVKGIDKATFAYKEGKQKIIQSSVGLISVLEPISGIIANGFDLGFKMMDLPQNQEQLFLKITADSREKSHIKKLYRKYLIEHVEDKLFQGYKVVIDFDDSFHAFEIELKEFYLKDLKEKEKELLSFYRQEDPKTAEYRFIRVKIQEEVDSEHLFYYNKACSKKKKQSKKV